jgi:hypothetical protein
MTAGAAIDDRQGGKNEADLTRQSYSSVTTSANAFPSMRPDERPEVPSAETQERQRRRDLRRAIAFGVVMATLQMGVLLYFAYC